MKLVKAIITCLVFMLLGCSPTSNVSKEETTKKEAIKAEVVSNNLLYYPAKGLKCILQGKMTYKVKYPIGKAAPMNDRYDVVLSQMFLLENQTKHFYKFRYSCRIIQGPSRYAEMRKDEEFIVPPLKKLFGRILQMEYSGALMVRSEKYQYQYLCMCSATQVQEPVGLLVMPFQPSGGV